ncbi:MAG: hypothetical protein V1911_00455 [Candidatus Micrarchaeota archaeon]
MVGAQRAGRIGNRRDAVKKRFVAGKKRTALVEFVGPPFKKIERFPNVFEPAKADREEMGFKGKPINRKPMSSEDYYRALNKLEQKVMGDTGKVGGGIFMRKHDPERAKKILKKQDKYRLTPQKLKKRA